MTEQSNTTDAVVIPLQSEEYEQFVKVTDAALLDTIKSVDPKFSTIIVLAMLETAVNAAVDAIGPEVVVEMLDDLAAQISEDIDTSENVE